MSSSQIKSLVLWSLIGWCYLMMLLHYLNPRPLWLDEQWVFVNIQNAPVSQLFTQAMSHDQEFPRVYLAAISLLSKNFDYHVLALRFFPFVSLLLAFAIWIYLASKQIQSFTARLTFFLCWAACAQLIYYSAELKQYSVDVLVSSVFFLFFYHQKDLARNASYGLLLIGLSMLTLVSYAALFFVLLPLYNLWKDAQKEGWQWFGIYLTGCISCIGTVYYYDFRLGDATRMVVYWKDYMISFDSPYDFVRSVQEGFNNLVSRWFGLKPKWLRAGARLFIGIGLVGLFCRSWGYFKKEGYRFKGIGTVAGFVMLELMILSACQKIPMGVPRICLFLAPILFFFTVETLQWVRRQRNYTVYALIQYPFFLYLIYAALGVAVLVFKGQLGPEPQIWG